MTPEEEIASTPPLSRQRFAAIWKHDKWWIIVVAVGIAALSVVAA